MYERERPDKRLSFLFPLETIRRIQMSREIITQENYQTLKKESTDRKSQRLSMYEKRIHALARRKGRREKK